jgi:hypothetical protein
LYFTADDGKLKDRVGDFKRINSSLKMPKNPTQQGKLLIRLKSPTLSFNLPSSAVKYKINVR